MDTLLDKEHFLAIADSLLTCKFGMRNAGYTWPVLTELYNALTGENLTLADLKRIGERIWTMERLYNLREGVGEDALPVRFLTEDLDDGQQVAPLVLERLHPRREALEFLGRRAGGLDHGSPSSYFLFAMDWRKPAASCFQTGSMTSMSGKEGISSSCCRASDHFLVSM